MEDCIPFLPAAEVARAENCRSNNKGHSNENMGGIPSPPPQHIVARMARATIGKQRVTFSPGTGVQKKTFVRVERDYDFNFSTSPNLWVTMGMHPMGCGIAQKLYYYFDRTTPICDTVDRLHGKRINGDKLDILMSMGKKSVTSVSDAAAEPPPSRWGVLPPPPPQNTVEEGVPMQYDGLESHQHSSTRTPTAPAIPTIPAIPATPAPSTQDPSQHFQNLANPRAYFSGDLELSNRTPEEERAAAAAENTDWHPICPGCFLTSSASVWQLTNDKDGWVCQCGTIVSNLNIKDTTRDKNCEESEDKTTRADVVYQPRSGFSQPALSAEDARKQRHREQTATFLSAKTAKKMQLGYQQQALVRETASEARKNGCVTDSNPYGWTPAERSKADSLMRALEELITKHRPMALSIQEYLRSETTRLWCRVVAHDRICTSESCTKRLSSRTLKVIASVAFRYHIDRMVHSICGVPHIPHENVRDLAERVAIDKQQPNAHQVSTRSMVSLFMERTGLDMPCSEVDLLTEDAFAFKSINAEGSTKSGNIAIDLSNLPASSPRSMSPSLETSGAKLRQAVSGQQMRKSSALSAAPPPRFARVDSGLNSPTLHGGLEEDDTPMLSLRQSIGRVHKLMGAAIAGSVRDKAVKLIITDVSFTEHVKNTSAMKMGDIAKSAFALMLSLNDLRLEKNGASSAARPTRPELGGVRRIIGIENEQEEIELITAMRYILPSGVWQNSDAGGSSLEEESDGLFA